MITVIIPVIPGGDVSKVVNSLKNVNDLQVIVSEGYNPPRQRNLAVEKAEGDIVFFFDNDTVISEGYFERALKHLKDCDIVGGPAETLPSDSFLQKCFGYVIGSYFATQSMRAKFKGVGKVRKATEKDLILCNLGVKKDIMIKNKFNENLYPNEENELLNRLKDKKIVYDPNLKIYRSRRKNLLKFIKQFFIYGRSRAEHIKVNPSFFDFLFVIPSLFVIYLVSLFFTSFLKDFMGVFLTKLYFIPLGIYLLMVLISAIGIVFSEKSLKTIFVTPFILPLVHISYGIGFVKGLFVKRKKMSLEVNVREVKL